MPVFLDDVGALFAQAGGKPVLTIASLNELFRRMHAGGPAQAAPFYVEAQANLEGFLLRRFTLNQRQLALLRETIQLRGAAIQQFIRHGLQALESNKPVLAPVASFDPKVSPLVRIRGFGEEVGACMNTRLGALTQEPGRARRLGQQCAPGEGGVARPALGDCEFAFQCAPGALPGAC